MVFALSQLDKFLKSILISLLSFLMKLVRNKRSLSLAKWWTLRSVRFDLSQLFVYPHTPNWSSIDRRIFIFS